MDSLIETLKNLGPGRLAMMLITFFGLLIFFIFIAVRSSAPSLTLLYGGLSSNDATEMAAKLDNAGIPYSLSEDGTKLSVPHKDVAKSRLLLAQEGLPHQGSMGYELFDQKQSFGATSFQQNINALRALEGELSRTISTIDQVKSARVHLVLPTRELFSREQQPASASVFLNLRNAAGIGAEQVQAIQHLVASSVPQLKPSRVAVIDQGGNLLARGEDDNDASATARNSADLRQTYERRLTRSIEDMVGRIVGYGKVRANVTADMNFDTVTSNKESYNPDQQVVRSTQTVEENAADSSGAANSTASVQNNLPGLPGAAASAPAGGSKNARNEETTNYEIGKTVEQMVRESGQVQKLSIAVLVDGAYVPDTSVTKPKDAKPDWQPPKKYVPRTKEELDQISNLVKSAVGFVDDENRHDKVEVVNMQFAETDSFDAPVKDDTLLGFPKSDLLGVAETLALSVVAVLIILLVLRPLATHFAVSARQAIAAGQDDAALLQAQQQAQLTSSGMGMLGAPQSPSELESMIDMSSVEGKVKASSVQKISELVTNHPNETISVIRQWMSQEG